MHDLNNYFVLISLSLERVERRVGDLRLMTELVKARAVLDTAARLARNLADYARDGAPLTEAVDLVGLVCRMLELLRGMIPSHVRVIAELGAEVPSVRGAMAELEQLILNLVLNACDAMEAGGDLSVAVRSVDGTTVTIEVSDTGGGLAEELGERSGATSPSSKPGRRGSGLGLGIVRSVVARHGAILRIRPRTGGGTVVSVTFLVGS
jgi:signal transduction histidine kinase